MEKIAEVQFRNQETKWGMVRSTINSCIGGVVLEKNFVVRWGLRTSALTTIRNHHADCEPSFHHPYYHTVPMNRHSRHNGIFEQEVSEWRTLEHAEQNTQVVRFLHRCWHWPGHLQGTCRAPAGHLLDICRVPAHSWQPIWHRDTKKKHYLPGELCWRSAISVLTNVASIDWNPYDSQSYQYESHIHT